MIKFLSGLIIGWIVGGLIVLSLYHQPKEDIIEGTVKLQQPEFFLNANPSIFSLKQACEYYDIQHSDIVIAQAILETGHFRSNICKTKNNLFGLYNSSKNEYFSFNHWSESIEAYKKMVQYKYKEGDYYKWLDTIGYAADPLYIDKLKRININ